MTCAEQTRDGRTTSRLDLARLPDRLRLPLAFDAGALASTLDGLTETDWTRHFVADHYRGDWSVLPLRAPLGASHPILRIVSNPGTTAWEDTEFLKDSAALRLVLSAFSCEIGAARLMRLTPGSAIREHCDPHLGTEAGAVRLHVPLATNPDVDFRLNGTRVDMAPGECWYLRLSDRHSVVNRGGADRVHLVIDAQLDEWITGLLRDAASESDEKRASLPYAPGHTR